MPVVAGLTALAPLDFADLVANTSAIRTRDSGSVLRPTSPDRGITARAHGLGPAQRRSRHKACRSSPVSKRPCHRRAALLTARVTAADRLALISPLKVEPLVGVAESRRVVVAGRLLCVSVAAGDKPLALYGELGNASAPWQGTRECSR